MVNQETVLERIMRFEPQAAVILDAVEDKDALKSDLERIYEFLSSHELRPGDSKSSHINYGAFVKTWYSTLSGRYLFDQDALPMLYSSMVKLDKLGVPLQLVECKDGRLSVFPLEFDVDIKISGDAWDPCAIETEIIDEAGGFRFFKMIAKLVELVYPSLGEILVFSASGISRSTALVPEAEIGGPTKKVSFRIVFPEIVIDKERAQLIWQHVTSRLTALSSEESPVPYIRSLAKRLKQLSSANESFCRVIDESIVKCKHGIRMPFNDKTEKGRSTGRVLRPLLALKGEKGDKDEKISNLVISKSAPSGDKDAELISWLEQGALTTPSLRHAGLTEWNRPNVRSTARVTKTGAGGSSLALTKLTTADAARAADRAAARRRTAGAGRENAEPVTRKYTWESGTSADFKSKLKVGITRTFEERQDGTVIWRHERRRNCWISFNEKTKCIETNAPDRDTLDYLFRLMQEFHGIVSCTGAKVAAPQLDIAKHRVIHAFKAEDEGEIDVEEGEILTVLSIEENLWAKVRRENGSEGYVPSDFIQKMDS